MVAPSPPISHRKPRPAKRLFRKCRLTESIVTYCSSLRDPVAYNRRPGSVKAYGGEPQKEWNPEIQVDEEFGQAEAKTRKKAETHQHLRRSLIAEEEGISLGEFFHQRRDNRSYAERREIQVRYGFEEERHRNAYDDSG